MAGAGQRQLELQQTRIYLGCYFIEKYCLRSECSGHPYEVGEAAKRLTTRLTYGFKKLTGKMLLRQSAMQYPIYYYSPSLPVPVIRPLVALSAFVGFPNASRSF